MASPEASRAVQDVLAHGKALLRYITANEVGLTGSHQRGYYLPISKRVWPLFTPQRPEKGVTHTHPVEITWPDGIVTRSRVKWYGDKSRFEYRLTSFNRIRGFPYLAPDLAGALLILIPVRKRQRFLAYVIDQPDDVEDVIAELGVSPAKEWALFVKGEGPEGEAECTERHFLHFARGLTRFPTGDNFSAAIWKLLTECFRDVEDSTVDDTLLRAIDLEYNLFRRVEQRLCEALLLRTFRNVDEFIATAKTITNRRKSRAGRSLENHVSHLLMQAGIPHDLRPSIAGKPDVVIPSRKAYDDRLFDDSRLFLIACKTTFKDRWPQVLKEGRRVAQKHLLTLQKGMALSQLQEFDEANVNVVVPDRYRKGYPRSPRVLSVSEFFDRVKRALR
jgi:hypothetical protein